MRANSPAVLVSLGLALVFAMPPLEAFAQLAHPGQVKAKVKRRNNGNADLRRSEFDERIDESRDFRREGREDWQEFWDSDEAREERERLQRERAGSHGKACIYGREGEVLHQPVGVECSTTSPGPKPIAKE